MLADGRILRRLTRVSVNSVDRVEEIYRCRRGNWDQIVLRTIRNCVNGHVVVDAANLLITIPIRIGAHRRGFGEVRC